MLHIAEVFCDGEAGEGDTHTCAWWFVHLTKHKAGLVDNATFLHFNEQVFPFTGTLADACEYGIAAVFVSDVTDELLDKDGLTYTGTAEETDLTTLNIRAEQVDDFDTGFEDFLFRALFCEAWCFAVDGPAFFSCNWASFVDRLTGDVEEAAESGVADWHGDWATGVFNGEPAHEPVGGAHSDGTNDVAAEMFGDFEGNVDLGFEFDFLPFVGDVEGVVDFWKLVCRELDVNDRTNDFYDFTLIIQDGSSSLCVH